MHPELAILSAETRLSIESRILGAIEPHPEPFKYSHLTKADIEEIIDEDGLFPEATAMRQRERRVKMASRHAAEIPKQENQPVRQHEFHQISHSIQPDQGITSAGNAHAVFEASNTLAAPGGSGPVPNVETRVQALSAPLAKEASQKASAKMESSLARASTQDTHGQDHALASFLAFQASKSPSGLLSHPSLSISSNNTTDTCQWLDCHQVFTTGNLLHEHICTDHIDRGKTGTFAQACGWTNCEHNWTNRHLGCDHVKRHCAGYVLEICEYAGCNLKFKHRGDREKHYSTVSFRKHRPSAQQQQRETTQGAAPALPMSTSVATEGEQIEK